MSGITKDTNGNITIKTLVEWVDQYVEPTFPNKKPKSSDLERDFLVAVNLLLVERTKLYKDIESKNDQITRGHGNETGPLRGEISLLRDTIGEQTIKISDLNKHNTEQANNLRMIGEDRDRWRKESQRATSALVRINSETQEFIDSTGD